MSDQYSDRPKVGVVYPNSLLDWANIVFCNLIFIRNVNVVPSNYHIDVLWEYN